MYITSSIWETVEKTQLSKFKNIILSVELPVVRFCVRICLPTDI